MAPTAPEPRGPVPDLDVQLSDHTTAVVLKLNGDVDLGSAPVLVAALHDALERGSPAVVVDLSAVQFLASSGMAALLDARQEAERRGCRFRLAGGDRAVRRPLDAAGLAAVFDHDESVQDALDALS